MAISYIAAVIPGDEAPDPTGWDKANHMIAFLTMAVLAALAYPRQPLRRLGAVLVGFGALIELTQLIPSLGRDAEWADLLADAAAVAVGLLLVRLIRGSRA